MIRPVANVVKDTDEYFYIEGPDGKRKPKQYTDIYKALAAAEKEWPEAVIGAKVIIK